MHTLPALRSIVQNIAAAIDAMPYDQDTAGEHLQAAMLEAQALMDDAYAEITLADRGAPADAF